MKINHLMSDDAVLAELGKRFARRRIDMHLTQADLAREAGVSKRTVERLEAGEATQISSVIRVSRVLDLIPGLDQWIPEAGPRPMDLIKMQRKERKRVTPRRKDSDVTEKWTWDE